MIHSRHAACKRGQPFRAPSGRYEFGGEYKQQQTLIFLYVFVCFSLFDVKTLYRDNIRGYNAKDLFLAQFSDDWNVMFDQNTPPEVTEDRFRITERITNRTDKEPN